ncbi:hypothetical protein Zmor_026305 [Zophobas morio]|uniref:Uncharacterized protein n=1 Tax=Zophobas morio TaxID=2755281 RepID=A0AA38HZ00_9CUCU|nr:hypothetical protein Zmor_026305 [Zophobas morio]
MDIGIEKKRRHPKPLVYKPIYSTTVIQTKTPANETQTHKKNIKERRRFKLITSSTQQCICARTLILALARMIPTSSPELGFHQLPIFLPYKEADLPIGRRIFTFS